MRCILIICQKRGAQSNMSACLLEATRYICSVYFNRFRLKEAQEERFVRIDTRGTQSLNMELLSNIEYSLARPPNLWLDVYVE